MKQGEAHGGARSEARGDAKIIRKILAENDIDALRAMEVLIATLVRDHLKERAKRRSKAINVPSVLWTVEKTLVEQRMANTSDAKAQAAERDVQGTLSVLLVTCRERAEDAAPDPTAPEEPRMRLVRD